MCFTGCKICLQTHLSGPNSLLERQVKQVKQVSFYFYLTEEKREAQQ